MSKIEEAVNICMEKRTNEDSNKVQNVKSTVTKEESVILVITQNKIKSIREKLQEKIKSASTRKNFDEITTKERWGEHRHPEEYEICIFLKLTKEIGPN